MSRRKNQKKISQVCKKEKYISTWVFLLLVILCLVKVWSPIAKYPLQIKESGLFVCEFLLVAILNLSGLDTDES